MPKTCFRDICNLITKANSVIFDQICMVRHGIELCAEGEQITTKGKTLYLVISNSAFNNSLAREWGKTTVANYLLAELTDLT